MNHENHIRRLRNKIFDYTGEKEKKADRILLKLKSKVIEKRNRPAGGTNYHWMHACE